MEEKWTTPINPSSRSPWRRLKLDQAFNRLLSQRGHRTPVERLIFAMVANQALDPGSKLAMEHWVANEVWIEGLPEVEVHQLYRAMDFLLETHDEIQRDVFYSVATYADFIVTGNRRGGAGYVTRSSRKRYHRSPANHVLFVSATETVGALCALHSLAASAILPILVSYGAYLTFVQT